MCCPAHEGFRDMTRLYRFIKDCKGTTAIEYALIGSVISVGIIVGATNVGSSTNNVYDKLQEEIRPELN